MVSGRPRRPPGGSVRPVFTVHARADGSRARAGTLVTAHGEIATPVFMPVGTRATVKTQPLAQLERLGAPMLLANTYHLMLRPGAEVFARFGGIHGWTGWRGAVLTDSGGFQVFSLARDCVITEDGARFRTATDGPIVTLTPESSIAMQRAIGSDVMMVFDHCVPSTASEAEARAAMERTTRWARRSRDARGDSAQQLFAIVQGACHPALRRASADALTDLGGFDGYAIGGLAVGEQADVRNDVTELTTERLPEDRPRYLMGLGTPTDLLDGVHRGVDLFDCIVPTAWAQHGRAFTSRGKVDLRRGAHRLDDAPLDPACDCDACARHPRSYLHHLIKAGEPVGWQLLAFHNLRFYVRLMADVRAAIASGTFTALYAARREVLARPEREEC